MKYLNLGAGAERWPDPNWVHLDDLHSQLPPGNPARIALDRETNYRNFVVLSGPLPFADNTFDGILASHFIEHFNAQDALKIMQDCLRILKPGGTLLVSVPDASYFRKVYAEDRNENWPELFETTDPANPIPTFFEAALWFEQHMQILTEDALWAHFTRAGFDYVVKVNTSWISSPIVISDPSASDVMCDRLNRLSFSLVMQGTKPL